MKWLRLQHSIIFVAITLVAIGCDRRLADVEYLERANSYHQEGDTRAAIIELKNSLQENPKNGEARGLLGEVYFNSGFPAQAEKELERSIEYGSTDPEIQVLYLRSLYQQNKFDELIDHASNLGADGQRLPSIMALEGLAYIGKNEIASASALIGEALKLDADNFMGLVAQTLLDVRGKNLGKAIPSLERALQIRPGSAIAWSLMGDIQTVKANRQEAIEAYDKAIEYRQNNARDRLRRAWLRMDEKDYDAARHDLKLAAKLQPNNGAIDFARGYLEYQEKNYEQAKTDLTLALNNPPGINQAYLYLGRIHQMEGHMVLAEESLRKFLTGNPKSSEGRLVLAGILLGNEEHAGAEKVLQPLIVDGSGDEPALALMSSALLGQGKTEEALEYLRESAANDPESADASARLAQGLLQLGDYQAGLDAMQLSIDQHPEGEQAYIALITSYIKLGQFDNALASAEEYRSEQSDSPMPLNLMGITWQGKGNLPKAIESYEEALLLSPGDISAGHNLAAIYGIQGRPKEVRRVLLDTLKHNENDLQALGALAQFELLQGNQEQAKSYIEQAIEAHPGELMPRIFFAQLIARQGNLSGAMQLLTEVEQAYAENPLWLRMVGRIQLAGGQPMSAIVTFNKLVKVNPSATDPHMLLARAYGTAGDKSSAIKELNKVLELAPGHSMAALVLSRYLTESGDLAEAEKMVEQLEQAQPGHPEVLARRGMLELRKKRYEEAVEAFEQAMSFAPSSQLSIYLARGQWLAGNQGESVNTLVEWLEQYPEDSAVRLELANKQLARSDYEQAIVHYEKVLEQNPRQVLALNNLAMLLKEKSPAEAGKYARQALAISPDAPVVIDTAAELMIINGDPQGAIGLLSPALEKSPDNLNLSFRLAQALSKAGEVDEAKEILRKLDTEQQFAMQKEARELLQELGN